MPPHCPERAALNCGPDGSNHRMATGIPAQATELACLPRPARVRARYEPRWRANGLARPPRSADWKVEVWWIYVVVALLLAFGIYAFMELAGFRTRQLTRRSAR